jgi:nucleotide-binding universal stress UspA family protein
MLRIERILCPVDFSEYSARAFDSAQSLARYYRARLFLQHVVDFTLPSYAYYADAVYITELFETLRDGARKRLRDFANSHTRTGMRPECFVYEGSVTDSILSFAAAQKVDLIVMGAHGRKGVDRATLGSAAEKVLRKARCPVLVSRKPAGAAAPDEAQGSIRLHQVIYCTDFSDPARRAWEYALSVAAEYDAEITLLHVLEDVQSLANINEAVVTATRKINKMIPQEGMKAARIKTAVRIGRAYEQIVQYASEIQADLLIMAVRGRNALDLAVFGSTTYRAVQLGSCSVLAVNV